MAKRVTIMVNSELDKKLRRKQAKLIEKLNKTISYSSVVNDVLSGKYKL